MKEKRESILSRAVKNFRMVFSPRRRHVAREVARETLAEGRRVGSMAIREVEKEAPKAKQVLKVESMRYAKNIKRVVTKKPSKSSKKSRKNRR